MPGRSYDYLHKQHQSILHKNVLTIAMASKELNTLLLDPFLISFSC